MSDFNTPPPAENSVVSLPVRQVRLDAKRKHQEENRQDLPLQSAKKLNFGPQSCSCCQCYHRSRPLPDPRGLEYVPDEEERWMQVINRNNASRNGSESFVAQRYAAGPPPPLDLNQPADI